MRARFVVVLMLLGLSIATLPFGGCGDNDNSAPVPCCPFCGDGVCSGDEVPCNCSQDCGPRDNPCAAIVPRCGDGSCQRNFSPGESHERCPSDCPLDCRQCSGGSRVFFDGAVFPGSSCPSGSTEAYRDGDYVVCDACTDGTLCANGAQCTLRCGPGCEDDIGGCCPVRVCGVGATAN